MDVSRRQEIAARLRAVLGTPGAVDLCDLAIRLRIDQMSLILSLDATTPYPTIDVIAAVVRRYGIDPWWLLTGEYSVSTHRSSLETTTEEMPAIVEALIGQPSEVWPEAAPRH
jgi:hypothetical protein